MRFDLELNIVSKLTQDGLNNLAESLYGDSNIVPMFWDESSSIEKIQVNKGAIKYSGYNNKKNIDDIYFSSGVDMLTDDLKFKENIIYGSTVVPVFNSGKYTVNRSKYIWSKNNIVKPCTYNGKRYTCKIDSGISSDNIIVSTTSFVNPGYNKSKRQFMFVPWDQLYFDNTGDLEATLDYIFKASLADYKFTVYNDTVYLSVNKISYKDIVIGKFQDTTNKLFVLPEFPFTNLKINNFTENLDYTTRSSIVIFNKDVNVNIGDEVVASFDVVPFVSYLDKRDDISDYVFFNSNMHPRVMNYKNGTLCLSNSLGGSTVPLELAITSNKEVVFSQEPFRVTAKLTGVGNIAIPNADVTMEILTDNAVFVENNNVVTTKPTLADGSTECDIVAKPDSIGYFIQKEWVSENKITVPFTINNVNINSVYTYFITSDDPILGRKFKSPYDEPFAESYTSKDISSYAMNGRKIAYVSLQDNNGKLVSRFIKPSSVNYLETKTVNYRDLYSDTRNSTGVTFKSIMDSKGIASEFVGTVSASGEYDTGVLPEDRLDIYSYEASGVTEFVFDKNIPTSSNISGYWLITDGSIKVKATYSDDNISLSSSVVSVDLQNIKSESSFVLNRENASLGASQLGAFGYLTISEYLKNQFGLNAFSIYCTHSDCIYKKCIHPNPAIRDNFILDEGKVGCIHNKEWDSENWVCPGQNAHLVNPFIMHLEEI